MRQHHNVLYVTTPNAYLHQHGDAVELKREDSPPARVPRHHLHAIVCLGPCAVSPQLMQTCAEEGIGITFLTAQGRFLARVVGPQDGNVLLRRDQYRAADDLARRLAVARAIVIGKIANSRTLLRRYARDHADEGARSLLDEACEALTRLLDSAQSATDLDSLRGHEGMAAKVYFGCFPQLLRGEEAFGWPGRVSRPAMDPTNAVLGFLYAILATECGSAAQAVGLDPQVGFLHVEKPGRPALSLDLMEEFRPVLADRLLFSLVNRRQLQGKHLERRENGAWLLTDDGRKTVLTAWHERKREEIRHPFLDETCLWGLVPHLQARLLARHIRGDLDAYPPFLVS